MTCAGTVVLVSSFHHYILFIIHLINSRSVKTVQRSVKIQKLENILVSDECQPCEYCYKIQMGALFLKFKSISGLMTFQLEYGFLSQEETKASLPSVLSEILLELNKNGKCIIQIGELPVSPLKSRLKMPVSLKTMQ